MNKEWLNEIERWVGSLFQKFRVTSNDGCVTLFEGDGCFYIVDNLTGRYVHLGGGLDFLAEEYPSIKVGSSGFYAMLRDVVNEPEVIMLLEV